MKKKKYKINKKGIEMEIVILGIWGGTIVIGYLVIKIYGKLLIMENKLDEILEDKSCNHR